MQGFARRALSALLFVSPCILLAQDAPQQQSSPPKQETPQPQTNPATQANLPNAPSSLITGKPHHQGQIPLEEIPHPPLRLIDVPLNVVGDTYRIFTSPIYIRANDLKWILPVAAATGVSLSLDTHVAKNVVSHDHGFNNANNTVSNGLLYSYIGGSVTMYGVGLLKDNNHLRETGLLSGQAQIDAYIFDTVIKLATFRERPAPPDYAGRFYQTSAGLDSSFVSGHSMLTWSAAAVIAAEYPSPWTQVGVYTGATATALTRVLAEKHFPTDVLLGSAAGWAIGHYVARAHHCHPIYRHNGNQPGCDVRTRKADKL